MDLKLKYSIEGVFSSEGFKQAQSGLKNLENQALSASKKLDGIGKSIQGVGRSLTSVIGTAAVAGFFGKLIKDASDAEETLQKFSVVFSDVRNEADAAAKSLRNNFGTSLTQAREQLGNTADLLTGFGFAQREALELSSAVNELAIDLASFTNFSGGAEGASAALTKALLGERESVKSLGISILETDVQKEVARLKTLGLTFATERQAKAQATLNIALSQSKNAIGDFARSQDSFANSFRVLRARISEVSEAFGAILLPEATKAVKVLTGFFENLLKLDNSFKVLTLSLIAFAAVLGPALIALGTLVRVVAFASAGVVKLAGAISNILVGSFKLLLLSVRLLFSKAGVILVGVGLVIVAFAELAGRILFLRERFGNLNDAITLAITNIAIEYQLLIAGLQLRLENFINATTSALNKLSGGTIDLGKVDFTSDNLEAIQNLSNLRDQLLEDAGLTGNENVSGIGFLADKAGTALDGLKEKAMLAGNEIKSLLNPTDGNAEAGQNVSGNTGTQKTAIELQLEKVGLSSESLSQTISSGFSSAFDSLVDGTKKASDAFRDFAKDTILNIGRVIQQQLILNAVQGIVSAGTGTPIATTANAAGGLITGAGTGTSDSITARLSSGEYVNTAKTVSTFGTEFFDGLRSIAHGRGFNPRKGSNSFADGGLAQGRGGATEIQFINNGTPQQVKSDTTLRDGQKLVRQIILEDLNDNGPVSKGIGTAFGVSRKGFA